ncbi:MAG TPA: DUF3108 domain-containing protein [Opitutaceae bacterium]|nr:DUF3108 domain-containing protein [Opitutaceae bacterium]
MTRVPLFLLLALTWAARSVALPLQPGEQLTYRVSWAVVPGAGQIKIAATPDPAAPRERMKVATTTATRAFARMLMTFDAKSEAIFDLKTGKLLAQEESTDQGEKHSQHSVTFDYAQRHATYTNRAEKPPTRELPMPAGEPTDLIMGLLQTRSWNLKPGEKQDALVLFDDDFYELTIHFARYENVTTPLGTYKTVVLEPRMERTAPKGMFKRGSKVRVWIAQDENRLPVKFEVVFKIGTGTATLESYTPPAGKTAAAATPPASNAQNPRS